MAQREPIPPGPNQESVWDYPRPPRMEPVTDRLRVVFAGVTVADTSAGFRVLETSHPPGYYLPPADVDTAHLEPSRRRSFCEYKGLASYWTLRVGDRVETDVAWSYPDPSPGFEALRDHLAFYAGAMDGCWVGEERAEPQPGGFYGGWVTSGVVGPFKGVPGSTYW